jgi:hypothetical protein
MIDGGGRLTFRPARRYQHRMSLVPRISEVLERNSLPRLAVKIVDRATRPFGFSLISFTPYGALPPPSPLPDDQVFDTIAQDNVWGSAESISGSGSELGATAAYRRELARFLPRFRSMFDAPCGDLHWMPLVLNEVPIDYIGGDISPNVIEVARKRRPDLDLRVFDILEDDFPAVDLWHCRDCFFHLSYAAIGQALSNFKRSAVPYVLLTTHRGTIRNVDNPTGGFRFLDLTRPPFNFPEPEVMLRDYSVGELPRFLGLWRREQLPEFSV